MADTIERSFFNKDGSCEGSFKWAREFKPDVIVLFIQTPGFMLTIRYPRQRARCPLSQ